MPTPEFISDNQYLPNEYVPSREIEFCGNHISNYQFLIDDNGFYPILIGDGEIPRIWLYARLPNLKIITLVDDSVANINQIKIDIYSSEKRIEVKDIAAETLVLKLSYRDGIRITDIDLRPLGYNIYGNQSNLFFGNSTFKGNTFNDVHTIFGFSGRLENTK